MDTYLLCFCSIQYTSPSFTYLGIWFLFTYSNIYNIIYMYLLRTWILILMCLLTKNTLKCYSKCTKNNASLKSFELVFFLYRYHIEHSKSSSINSIFYKLQIYCDATNKKLRNLKTHILIRKSNKLKTNKNWMYFK